LAFIPAKYVIWTVASGNGFICGVKTYSLNTFLKVMLEIPNRTMWFSPLFQGSIYLDIISAL